MNISQRDFMRQLYQQHNGNESAIIDSYAQAEREGKVLRESNDLGLSPEQYASRLLNDGVDKNWIQTP